MRGKLGARSRLGKGEVTSSKQWKLKVKEGSVRVRAKVDEVVSDWLKWCKMREWENGGILSSAWTFHSVSQQVSCWLEASLPLKAQREKHENAMRKQEEKRCLNSGDVIAHEADNSRNISVWTERGGVEGERNWINCVNLKRKKREKLTLREKERGRMRRKMPPDRRSSGKQKRLHTLLGLISLRVLSNAGSVSVTPFPPSSPPSTPSRPFSFHLIPPSPPPHLPTPTSPPSSPVPLPLATDPVIRPELTSGGPTGAGGPETEADSMAEAASTQAVGTVGPAHLDPVAPHVHQKNTKSWGCALNSWNHKLFRLIVCGL